MPTLSLRDIASSIDGQYIGDPKLQIKNLSDLNVCSSEEICYVKDERFISKRDDLVNAFSYMGLKEKQNVNSIELDKIFIGSCTNSRIEDLRVVADIVKNKKVAKNIKSAITF